MTHAEASTRIDAYDALSPDERRDLERHAAECTECDAALAAVRRLLGAARALPHELAPRHDLWPELVAAMQDAGSRRHDARTSPPVRWAIAAAVAAVCVVSIGLGVRRDARHRAPALPADDAFSTVVSGLALQCSGAGRSLQALLADGVPVSAVTAAAADVSAGLVILDRSIDETQAALASAPRDPTLERMLAARYQQKLALLHAALLRVEST